MWTAHERVRRLREAADSAHQLERMLLSVAESVARGEPPDRLTLSCIPSDHDRIGRLLDALPKS